MLIIIPNISAYTLADRREHRYRRVTFSRTYSRSPLRLGELRQRNAYEIVRIPRAGSASSLVRTHSHVRRYIYIHTYIATALTQRQFPGDGGNICPICLIKSVCAITGAWHIARAIVPACCDLGSARATHPPVNRASLSGRRPLLGRSYRR